MNKAHIVIHTHESSPGWLLKLTQANQSAALVPPGGDPPSGPTGTYVRGVDPQKGFQNNQNTS